MLGLTVLVLLTAPGLKTRTAVTLAIFCGGAISNLFDRCAYGAVVDFLNFGITGLRPYIFNVADLEIAIGGVFFLYIIARNIVRISFSRNHSE